MELAKGKEFAVRFNIQKNGDTKNEEDMIAVANATDLGEYQVRYHLMIVKDEYGKEQVIMK